MGPTVRKGLDDLRRMIEAIETLESECVRLTQHREALQRFLDIDGEKAQLEALRQQGATLLTESRAEANGIVAHAKADAEDVRRTARDTAEQGAQGIIARAAAEGERLLGEARTAVTAAQEEARRIVARAQGEAGGLVRDAEATQAAAAKAFADATLALVQVEGREKAVADQERDLRQKHEDLRKHTAAMRAAVISLE